MTGKNYSALSVERGLLSVPVLLVVLGIPTLALAQDVVARSAVQLHIDQSVAYYTHGDLRHAIGELQVAQQLAPADRAMPSTGTVIIRVRRQRTVRLSLSSPIILKLT